MPFVHTHLTGAGTPENRYRVNFPTYSLKAVDYSNRQAIVEIPDADLPEGLQTLNFEPVWANGKSYQVCRLRPEDREAWNQCLRGRYPEGHSDIDVDAIVKPRI